MSQDPVPARDRPPPPPARAAAAGLLPRRAGRSRRAPGLRDRGIPGDEDAAGSRTGIAAEGGAGGMMANESAASKRAAPPDKRPAPPGTQVPGLENEVH